MCVCVALLNVTTKGILKITIVSIVYTLFHEILSTFFSNIIVRRNKRKSVFENNKNVLF